MHTTNLEDSMSKFFGGVIASAMLKDPRRGSIMEIFGETVTAQTREVRLDPFGKILTDGIFILNDLHEEIAKKQTLFTLRSIEQGGSEFISLRDQYYFYSSLPSNLAKLLENPESKIFADFGLDLFNWILENKLGLPFPRSKIVLSYHDFNNTGTRESLAVRHSNLVMHEGVACYKFVTTATQPGDWERLMEVFKLHEKILSPLMAFSMGEIAQESRIKCTRYGSVGTYGFIPGRARSANGQLSFMELLEDMFIQEWLKKNLAA